MGTKTEEQADCIFQIISKRTKIATTIVTTNLLCGVECRIFNNSAVISLI